MEKLNFSIVIDAPKEKVWKTVINKDTYEQWAAVFMPGSHFVGDWSEGSKILFLAPDESGKMSGTVFQVKENKPYEFVSIENIGMVEEGKEDITSKEATVYAGALENYTLKELNGSTEVLIEQFPVRDIPPDYKKMYQNMWQEALKKLKDLVEK